MTRRRIALAGIIAALLAVPALVVFEPWTLFTDSEVNEALPVAAAPVAAAGTESPPTGEPVAKASTPEPGAPAGPAELSTGQFVDAEHSTSGTARILRLEDGRRILRLENLNTSNGPDLHVWLSSATAGGSWFKYDDGSYLRLGALKGNRGSQNYLIPADADLTGMRSAVIWCDRFNVAFGAAPVALRS